MYHKIINGETLNEMQKMPAKSIDLIFADPPYWMRTEGVLKRVEGTDYNGCADGWDQFNSLEEYEEFTRKWLTECYRVLKPNGSIWVIGGMQCIYTIGAIMQQLGYWIINDVVWHKKNPTPNFMGTRLNNSHETLIWATKSKKAKFTFNYKTAKELNIDTVDEDDFQKGSRKQLGSVWKIAVCQGNERIKDENGEKLHSTQKPEELLYRIIAISSNKEDVILDPFGGTMTTAAMAKKLGRSSIMIEKDTQYCEYGQRRIDIIEYEDTPIANAIFDQKPKKATMPDMITAGYFTTGESFYFRNGEEVATLLEDGKLLYQGQPIDMHSCAAKAREVKAKRLNGFDVWFVKRNSELVSIATIREKYRQTI
ncbi:MAG: site-specific DNA-methyltransferase [Clostridia bacterium]|nr:site-specific DNA-methyltransferase [Clostridia bacterium]